METPVPSMPCVLWGLGLLPLVLWWLCGVWYLQHQLAIAAAAATKQVIAGKIRHLLWPSSWRAAEWLCSYCHYVWEWETNGGSNDSRRPRTTVEHQEGTRSKEKREFHDSHDWLNHFWTSFKNLGFFPKMTSFWFFVSIKRISNWVNCIQHAPSQRVFCLTWKHMRKICFWFLLPAQEFL